jgi:hypothetical protein
MGYFIWKRGREPRAKNVESSFIKDQIYNFPVDFMILSVFQYCVKLWYKSGMNLMTLGTKMTINVQRRTSKPKTANTHRVLTEMGGNISA